MFRILGLLTCAALLSTSMWLSSRTQAQEAAGQPDVNPFENFQLPAAQPAAPASSPEVNRRRVDDLMTQATKSLQAGETRQALFLASKAAQIAGASGITFSPFEKSPQQLIAEINGGGETVASFGAPPESVEEKREYVQKVLQSARQDITAQNFDSAIQKIELAKSVDVTYGVFDLQPDHVLVELARHQPASEAGPSESLANHAFAPTPGVARQMPTEAKVQLTPKQEATELVAAAKVALSKGNMKEARELALQAQQYQVAWGLFEEKPESILAEVGRSTNTEIITTTPQGPSPSSENTVPADQRQLAIGLLKESRELMKSGNLDAAKAKATEASQYQVSYGLFDDQPELVLQEIRTLQSSQMMQPGTQPAANSIANAEPQSAGAQQQQKEKALKLLSQAREQMRSGKLNEAQQLVAQAEAFDVAYGLFDDTPEVVKEDLSRIIAANGEASGNPFANNTAPALPTETRSREELKQAALELVADARNDIAAGHFEAAQAKANQAGKYNVAYDLFEDSPEQVLSDLASQTQLARNTAMPTSTPLDLTDETQVVSKESFTGRSAVMTSEFVSAQASFDKGVAALRDGNRELAYANFLQAYNSDEKLDTYRQQQLQDKLRELAPRRGAIQQASGQQLGAPGLDTDRLDTVMSTQSAQFDKLRTESLNAIFRAERMREKNPEQAVVLLNQVLESIENSELSSEQTAAIAASVKSSKTSIEGYIKQKAPILAMERQGKEVKDLIEVEIQTRVRVEQELAKLVDDFNNLMDQKRYHEAHAKAQQAKELDPENPVTVSMDLKSTFAMRNDQIENLKSNKEKAFYNELQDVEESIVSPIAGGKNIAYPANWEDLKKRRQPLPADAGEHSPTEMRVRQSLANPVSLHFEGESLTQIMQYISDTQGINVVVDEAGLAEEGVTSSTPISIGVDGIQLRSALNLMLHPLNLDYVIDNEVLNVTSRMKQQGELASKVYRVADLVVPVSIRSNVSTFQPGTGFGGGATNSNLPQAGLQSMPSYTGLPGGNGFAQMPAGAMGGLGPQGIPGLGEASKATAQNYDFSSLQSLITTTVSPDSWDEVAGFGSMDVHESTLSLVVRQTQKVHQEIADLLDQLRRLQDLQVTIEVRFITVSDQFFEQIGIDFDFNVNDTIGGPGVDNTFSPLRPFGSVDPVNGSAGGAGTVTGNAGNAGGNNAQNQTSRSLAPFSPQPSLNRIGRDNWPGGTVVGLINNNETFSPELDIPFRQGSFDIAAPSFGGFDPNAGIQFGMAILSDIEAFMFVRAAQGDRRSNIMFAPKLTLFNGSLGTVQSQTQRPFVVALIPVASAFNIGFQPIIQTIPEGTSLTVQAVVSADRRYVRLSVLPVFSNITDVFTFSFISGGGITGNAGGGGGQGGGGGALGGGGGGQGGQGGGQGGQQGQQGGGGGGSVTVQQPVVDIVTVDTVVSVPDGGTVLLGGVKTLREGRNMAGVPILNKIPYISRLFKNTGVGRETESLMLMVTPRIIIQEEEEELLGIPN